MILLEVDANGIALVKFKCDAPGSIDVNRMANRDETAQGMVIETRQVHFFRRGTRIKPVKPQQNAPLKPFVDPGGPAG